MDWVHESFATVHIVDSGSNNNIGSTGGYDRPDGISSRDGKTDSESCFLYELTFTNLNGGWFVIGWKFILTQQRWICLQHLEKFKCDEMFSKLLRSLRAHFPPLVSQCVSWSGWLVGSLSNVIPLARSSRTMEKIIQCIPVFYDPTLNNG